jgi:hypothetical protein
METTNVESIERKVTIPLSVDLMKEVFMNREKIKYTVDYANSSIKGDQLLTYLANLELNPDFDLSETTTVEKHDFIAAFMKLRAFNASLPLSHTIAHIMLFYKDIDHISVIEKSVLSNDEIPEFIAKYPEVVEKWATFLDSILLLYVRAFDPQISLDEFEDVNDAMYITVNVLNVIQIEGFIEAFVSKPSKHPLKWFKMQFEEGAFKGLMLTHYILNSKNPLCLGIDALANGDITPEMIAKVSQELSLIEKTIDDAVVSEGIV